MGNVIFYRADRAFIDSRPDLLAHESGHATQYAWCLGLPFLPLYAACAAFSLWRTGDPGSRNFFERNAGLELGGYRELPTIARLPALRNYLQRLTLFRSPRSTSRSRGKEPPMTEPLNSITVTGQGTVQTAPDFFNINIGIEAQKSTVREAYAAASEALNAVNAKLLSLGVAREVISSSSLDVRVDTRWQEGTGSVVTGYTVSSTLSVALRYDQGAQDVIAAVVDTGNNSVRLNGLTPVVSNPAAAQDAARAVAWADALRAAELYAQLAGRSPWAPSQPSLKGRFTTAHPGP